METKSMNIDIWSTSTYVWNYNEVFAFSYDAFSSTNIEMNIFYLQKRKAALYAVKLKRRVMLFA